MYACSETVTDNNYLITQTYLVYHSKVYFTFSEISCIGKVFIFLGCPVLDAIVLVFRLV